MPIVIPLKEQLQIFEEGCFSSTESKKIISMYNSCVEQTRQFVNDSGFSDCVIGISGGIDSALVACIAVDAFGSDHVHGLILPGPYSSQESISDATKLCINLNIDFDTVPINSAFDSVRLSVNNSKIKLDDSIKDLTAQNIQARVRMIIIMVASNENNWLMLNTANKSEVYTGYSTLYGDMAGGYAPLGDVYKCDVFKMAIAKNLQYQRKHNSTDFCIPQNILIKPPSAELSNNQTDENSLGIDYATLDAILKEHIDNNKNSQDIIYAGYNPNDVDLVLFKIKKSEYKRRYEPPCAKL